MGTGSGNTISSPKRPSRAGLGQAGGRPVEIWIAAALLVLSGAYLIVRMFGPGVRRDLSGFDDVFDLASWWIFWPWLVLFVVSVAFVVVAFLLFQGSAIAYRLVALLSAGWALSVVFARSPDQVAWLGRESSYLIVVVATLAAASVLVASPATKAFFASRDVVRGSRPTSVMVVRAVMSVVAGAVLVSAVLDIVLAQRWGYIREGRSINFVLLVASPVLLIVSSQLYSASRVARVAVSVVGVALFVLGLMFDDRTVPELHPLALAAVVPIGLWVPSDARRFFGDAPLTGAGEGTAVRPVRPSTVHDAPIACLCGSALGAVDVFCGNCGTPKPEAPTCTTCGMKTDAAQMFCHGCGTAVDRATTVVGRVAPSAGLACSSCGLPAELPGDRFCASCGHQYEIGS